MLYNNQGYNQKNYNTNYTANQHPKNKQNTQIQTQQTNQAPQQQSYIIKKDIIRKELPKIIELILLGGLFYLGIIINLKLLQMQVPKEINSLFLVIMIVLIIMQTAITYLKNSKIKYVFYPSKIEKIDGKNNSTLYYQQITNISLRRSLIDKIFKTGDIILEPGMNLSDLKNPQRIYVYIKQLIRRANPYMQTQ